MAQVIWVTGAGGLIGHHLVKSAPLHKPDWDVRPLTRESLDLLDFGAVERAYASERPALVIHCAALSKSPQCEANPKLAWRINHDCTRHLAELAHDGRLIFFSTDLVFDGRAAPYQENAPVNPLSVYAETKASAEKEVLKNPRHAVLRTSLNGGVSPTGDRGFNEQLRHAWARGETTRLFTDEYRSPISASVTASAVWEIVARGLSGLLHLAGRERLSRWEIGQLLAARWPGLNPRLESASLRGYVGPARPPDTTLDCSRLQEQLPFPLWGLREWLAASPNEPF